MSCTLVYSNCSQEASRAWCLCRLYNTRPTTQGVLFIYSYYLLFKNCPHTQDSILDIRVPIFSHGQVFKRSSKIICVIVMVVCK